MVETRREFDQGFTEGGHGQGPVCMPSALQAVEVIVRLHQPQEARPAATGQKINLSRKSG
jgi:hypothetical protein